MGTEDSDLSVLNNIDRLVKEEEGLYERSLQAMTVHVSLN
jgi:hypothetical protein